MMLETTYTPHSNIRMESDDNLIKVYWVDPRHRQRKTLLAVWTLSGWSLMTAAHQWLWQKVKIDLSKWLRESFKTLHK